MRQRYEPSEIEERRAGWLHEKLTGEEIYEIPDYFNSLDAVRVLEMALQLHGRQEYVGKSLRNVEYSLFDIMTIPAHLRMAALFRVKIYGVSAEEVVR